MSQHRGLSYIYKLIHPPTEGLKDHKIVGIGKAGNPDVMEGVGENLVVGVCTDVIAAEGRSPASRRRRLSSPTHPPSLKYIQA